MDTNLDGVFHTCKAAYPLLKKAGKGKIVIVSSIAGEKRAGHAWQYSTAQTGSIRHII